MYSSKYCHLCLVIQARSFMMNSATLEAYSKLVRLPVHNKEPYICYECLALLLKYEEFHEKCIRAHKILNDYRNQCSQITLETLESQRKIHKLESKLSLCHISDADIRLHGEDCGAVENVSCKTDSTIHSRPDFIALVSQKPKAVQNGALLRKKSRNYKISKYKCELCLRAYSSKAFFDNHMKRHRQNKKLPTDNDSNEEMECVFYDVPSEVDQLDNKPVDDSKINVLDVKNEIRVKDEKSNEFADGSAIYNSSTVGIVIAPAIDDSNEVLTRDRLKTERMEESDKSTGTSVIHLDVEILPNIKKVIIVKEENNVICNDFSDKPSPDSVNGKGLKRIAKKRKPKKEASSEDYTSCSDLDDEPLAKVHNLKKPIKRITQKTSKPQRKGRQFDGSFCKGFATILDMTPEEARNAMLLRKETSNYRNTAYKCELCFRGFIAKTTFDNHMKKHTQEFGSLECEYCYLRFPDKNRLSKHTVQFHTRKYVCKLCDYVCFATTQAKSHVSMHKGKKFTCNECDASFSQFNTMLAHKRRSHLAECVCALCGDVFVSAHGLDCHRNLRHKQESPALCGPRCAECVVQFATEAAYERHLTLSTKHKKVGSFRCEVCAATYSTEDALRGHAARRHKPSYDCTVCPATFPSRKKFRSHMTQHRGHVPKRPAPDKRPRQPKPYTICEYCGKEVKRYSIVEHIREHTGERPYACDSCDKRYRFQSALHVHKQIHTVSELFQCHVCAAAFNRKATLAKHLKTHTGVRPFKCDLCGKGFLNACDITAHKKYTHQNVPWPKSKKKAKQAEQPRD